MKIGVLAVLEKAMTRSPIYWNTTELANPELAQAIASAEDQNAKVLRIMREYRVTMTAWDVWDAGNYGEPDKWWLIGSVRRAMTTLADPRTGALVNLGTKRRSGPRNKLCFEYALSEDSNG